MKQLAAHDFTLYLQTLLRARASQQLEPVRMLVAQYQGVLARFPHLEEEVAAFLEPDTGRDYGIVALSLKQGLIGLEKLLEAVDKATADWGSEIETYELMASAELYSTRVAQQSLQKTLVALRQKRERERRASEELSRRHAEGMAEMKRQADEELRRSVQGETVSPVQVLREARRKARQSEQAEPTDLERKRLEVAEAQYSGWRKVGNNGEVLPANGERWAAVIDERHNLMWAVNWQAADAFPNRGELTWYNPDRATNGGSPGNPNNGQNIHDWLQRVNQEGWCGYHDWRIPTLEELKTLLTDSIHTYYHIREDVFTDMGGLGSRFWSSTPDKVSRGSAYGVYFAYGHDGTALKTYPLFLRVVRTVAPVENPT